VECACDSYDSIKGGRFHGKLNDYQLLSKDSGLWELVGWIVCLCLLSVKILLYTNVQHLRNIG
jgi:hypothetical protein